MSTDPRGLAYGPDPLRSLLVALLALALGAFVGWAPVEKLYAGNALTLRPPMTYVYPLTFAIFAIGYGLLKILMAIKRVPHVSLSLEGLTIQTLWGTTTASWYGFGPFRIDRNRTIQGNFVGAYAILRRRRSKQITIPRGAMDPFFLLRELENYRTWATDQKLDEERVMPPASTFVDIIWGLLHELLWFFVAYVTCMMTGLAAAPYLADYYGLTQKLVMQRVYVGAPVIAFLIAGYKSAGWYPSFKPPAEK